MDTALAEGPLPGYASRSQWARVLTENWVQRQLPCLYCSSTPLQHTPANTKSRDFECPECGEPYELKATSGRYVRWIVDGEYHTLLRTIRSERTPNLLLMEYDRQQCLVRELLAVHRSLVSLLAVVPRRPLSPLARRAGWQGCNIDLHAIPEAGRVPIVRNGTPLPWTGVVDRWSHSGFLRGSTPERRSWIRDVLSCVQRLPQSPFSLREVYAFETELARIHPSNRNIGPKIRQQLQILVAQGLLRRESPGMYSLVEPKTEHLFPPPSAAGLAGKD